jgi:acetolactate synthase-1/2/3 large subunit
VRVADYIVKELEKYTDHVFCVVGGGSMFLNNALYDSKITPVFMLHEQGAAFAAQAYGHLANKLGVCMVTSGPGATNAITGCLAAWMDSTPVLFISGQAPTNQIHTVGRYLGSQECDIISMVENMTKESVMLSIKSDIKHSLSFSITQATTGRKGPVWLDVPLDVQSAEVE